MSPTWRAISTASLLSSARRSRGSEKLSSIASRATQPRAQRRVVVADRLQRLLEQLHELLVDDRRPPSGRARRSRARPGRSSCAEPSARAVSAACAERRVRLDRVARLGLGVAAGRAAAGSGARRRRAPARARPARPRTAAPPPRRRARRWRAGRRARRTRRPSAPRARAARARSGGPARPAAVAAGLELLERLGDAQVQPRAARGGEPVVERLADQRVGEAAAAVDAGHLGDHVRADALLDRPRRARPRRGR